MGPVDTTASGFARLRTLPLGAVQVGPGFWEARQRINRSASLGHVHAMLERSGNLDLLGAAASHERRSLDATRVPPFLDSDVYKWLEAVAWSMADGIPRRVARAADEAIELVIRAQAPDGYLNTFVQVGHPERRWADLAYGHELYCAGHLIQAGIAWQRACGDPRLLGVARRLADLIAREFGPGRRQEPDGHAGIETALVELYRETGERRYLDTAGFLLDQRGQGLLGDNVGRWYWGGRAYFQDHVPVRQARSLEGHAVRALYLTTGVVDAWLERGEAALLAASRRQWQDLVDHKLYVTGGIGSRTETEGMGDPYELPPDRGYCETCAAVASVQWNWRLLLATRDPRYADLIERTLYNAVLAGVAADGRAFFYGDPLASRAGQRRSAWYYVACCPPNLMRLVASIRHYVATADEAGIQVHQYLPGTVRHEIGGAPIDLRVETDYPWDGTIRIIVERSPERAWRLDLRVPGWSSDGRLVVRRAGDARAATREVGAGRVVGLRRRWRTGDTIELSLPMSPRFTEAHPLAEAYRGQVALERGPLVYCWEACDQAPDVQLGEAAVDAGVTPRRERGRDWADVVCLRAAGRVTSPDGQRGLYRPVASDRTRTRAASLLAVPYYLWANRRPGAMRTWLPRSEAGEEGAGRGRRTVAAARTP